MVLSQEFFTFAAKESNMKKLLLALGLLLALSACFRQRTYHTYYGGINTDTMQIAFYDIKDSLPCYLVKVIPYDSVEIFPGEWKRIKGPVEFFFCPSKGTYYYSFPDNQGNRILNAYNPITKELSNPDMK